jgi:lysophospholipase L1-like esterase
VAADSFSSAIRSHFVERYGAGEGGLYLPDLPVRHDDGSNRLRLDATAHQRLDGGSRLRFDGRWKVVPVRSATGGESGLAGGWAEAASRGATLRLAGPFAEGRILLLRQPGGGTASVRVDGRIAAERRLSGAPGLEVVSVSAAGGEGREIEVIVAGDGPVRFLGALLDSGRQGAVYYPVGVNGALASWLLKIPERLFSDQLQAVEPDLVILAFGTNEARTFDPDQMSTLVARIRRAVPAAQVIVVGPPDQARRTRSGGVAAVPARDLVSRAFGQAARQSGALFVDLAEAMGGEGAIRAWSAERPALVQEDLVHFTSAGYLRLARLLAGALDGRETMIRIPAASAAPSGGIRFERDSSGRIRLTNQPPGSGAAPILGTARNRN